MLVKFKFKEDIKGDFRTHIFKEVFKSYEEIIVALSKYYKVEVDKIILCLGVFLPTRYTCCWTPINK